MIIGSGRSGRGMIGEMYDSIGGYHLNFADIDTSLVNGLQKQKYYKVIIKNLINGNEKERIIKNFDIYDIYNDREEYINKLAESKFVHTALFPEAFDQAIIDLVDSIKLKKEKLIKSLTIVVLGANYIGLEEYFKPRIINKLNSEEKEFFENNYVVVGSNANRKVIYSTNVSEYELTADDKNILKVNNSPCFDKDFKYPNFFEIVDNIEIVMIEKIWSQNLEHIILALMGAFKGYSIINESIEDEYIKKVAYNAWLEARLAMKKKYDIPIPDKLTKINEYKKFDSQYFEDTLKRIGRDLKRKLKRNDRLIGPALLCLETGIIPYFITKGIAYGFYYNDDTDDTKEINCYTNKYGILKSVEKYCELDKNNKNENIILQLIVASYNDIKDEVVEFY